ncbi:MAG TPA: hypothetical protein VE865_02515 [Bradyrhizobium sp.]|nr:hypothetical protein [Bradyrhizobium sp.]
MSDQESKPVSDNLGDVVAVPTSSKLPDVTPAPAAAPSGSVEAPKIVPEQAPAESAKEAPKVEPIKVEAPKVEAKPAASQILIMPPDKGWTGDRADRDSRAGERSGIFGKRRAAAVAAIVVLAAAAGAVGGALATAGLSRPSNDTAKVADRHGLEDSISRIDTEIAALRTSLEQASKHSASQISKSSDRLDRIEKAQAEPAAKLAKLSETVEKLRVAAATPPVVAPAPAPAPVAAAAPATPKETTATVQTANAAPGPIPMPAPKPEVARLPTVEGWVLRDVSNGVALIEGRQGIFEVYAGDPIPGLGRIDAIRKQDGHWVVITSRGLIVGR